MRKIFDFHGGIHPPENKRQSQQGGIRDAGIPPELVLPLSQHIGAPAKPTVAVGDRVLKGQMIAEANPYYYGKAPYFKKLTFLFTDLKGSTALYERVGDLAAFDLVRAHFHALLDIISESAGAVVKTIGDAVMATFVRPEQAFAAALRMREAMDALNEARGTTDLVLKIGIHEGPCLAVMLNERQDYFGQTVNIASRVQGLSVSQAIHITGPVIETPEVADMLSKASIAPIRKHAALRGITDKVVVYEIP